MPGTGTSKRSSAGSELRARVNAARDPETAGRTARGANGAEDPTARTAPRITAAFVPVAPEVKMWFSVSTIA